MKIVLLGFNKCGTTSFHKLFSANGLNSRHHGSNNTKKNLALALHKNLHLGENIFKGIDFDCIMDISYLSEHIHIEGQFYYKEMFESEPDSYFILNTRPIDRWIQSRLRHGRGGFAERFGVIYGVDDLSQMTELWTQQWHALHNGVTNFFKSIDNKEGRFLKFDIENDDPNVIKDFLLPDFPQINLIHWGRHNATK